MNWLFGNGGDEISLTKSAFPVTCISSRYKLSHPWCIKKHLFSSNSTLLDREWMCQISCRNHFWEVFQVWVYEKGSCLNYCSLNCSTRVPAWISTLSLIRELIRKTEAGAPSDQSDPSLHLMRSTRCFLCTLMFEKHQSTKHNNLLGFV